MLAFQIGSTALALPAGAVLDTNDRGPVLECGGFTMRVTNAGIIGNAFFNVGLSSDPSFEFPSHSGIELLNYAALWIGARTERDGNRVSGGPLLEWRPTLDPEDRVRTAWHGRLGTGFRIDDDGDGRVDEEVLNGRDDDHDGEIDEDLGMAAQQMLAADYVDDRPEAANYIYEGSESNRPLHISVHQEVFGWSTPGYENIAGLQFHVTNHGTEVLHDVYIGLFADFDVGRRADRSSQLNDLPFQANFFTTIRDDCIWRFERSVPVMSEGPTSGRAVASGSFRGLKSAADFPSTIEKVAERGDLPLTIEKIADRSQVHPGDRVSYRIVVHNVIHFPLATQVCVLDRIPAGFKYVRGSARLDGVVIADPVGVPAEFSFFGMPEFVDLNGDNIPGPCEPGYRTLTYQLEAGPTIGDGNYFNSAVACTGSVRKVASDEVHAMVKVLSTSSSLPLITLVPLDRTTDPTGRIPPGIRFRTALFERNHLPGQGGVPPTDADRYAALAGNYAESSGEHPGDYVVLVSRGPIASLAPGQSIDFAAALVAAEDAEGLFTEVQKVMDIHPGTSWLDPGTVPPAPELRVVPLDHAIRLEWNNRPEILIAGGVSGPPGSHFVGYNVYKLADWRQRESLLPPKQNWSLMASVGPDTGYGQIPLGAVTDSSLDYERILYEGRLYPIGRYRLTDSLVKNGFDYVYAVSTVWELRDANGASLGRLESPLPVRFGDRVTPHAASRDRGGGVWVVPNPFRAAAAWDRPSVFGDVFTRHIDFMGLPRARCTIKIWTVAGDLVAVLDHDASRGDGQVAWDLVSRNGQDVESGLYIFTVDSSFGHQVGRFVVIR